MKVSAGAGRHAMNTTTRATFVAPVRKAFGEQSTLINRPEHCSLDPERLASIGLVCGSQIRVIRSSEELALYTISETRPEPIDTTVRMGSDARQRLRAPDAFDATIDTQVPHPTLSDDEAEACSEFVERLDDNGYQQKLVALAPHGGAIERHTDSQAERVGSVLGSHCASVWRCRGFKSGGGALERWHITSSEISDASFPLLRTIASSRLLSCGRLPRLYQVRRPRRRRRADAAQRGDRRRPGESARACRNRGAHRPPLGQTRRRQPEEHRQPPHGGRRERRADRTVSRGAYPIRAGDCRRRRFRLPREN